MLCDGVIIKLHKHSLTAKENAACLMTFDTNLTCAPFSSPRFPIKRKLLLTQLVAWHETQRAKAAPTTTIINGNRKILIPLYDVIIITFKNRE